MKALKIFIGLLFFCAASANAQVAGKNKTWTDWDYGLFEKGMGIPSDTFPVPVRYQSRPHIATNNGTLYLWSPVQLKWVAAGGGGGGAIYTATGSLQLANSAFRLRNDTTDAAHGALVYSRINGVPRWRKSLLTNFTNLTDADGLQFDAATDTWVNYKEQSELYNVSAQTNSFTLPNTPVPGSVEVKINGLEVPKSYTSVNVNTVTISTASLGYTITSGFVVEISYKHR